ncbi:MAG TPA: hypothetical protein VGQ73_00950 [Gemmatimonadales bacterium]|jgi:hypothetical protein|nr:hypothetical protein [Gemmatimonadales bacterium]
MTSSSSRLSLRADERGIALAIALLAMIVIGALVTGAFFAGRIEIASGRNAVYTSQATEAAEAGIADLFRSWSSAWNSYNVDVDQVQSSVYPVAGNNSIRYTVTVRRLQAGVFQFTVLGEKLDASGNVMASRLLAKLGRLAITWLDTKAAVTAKGDVSVSGTATKISGYNTIPTGWGGCITADSVYGIRTSGTVSTSGHPTIEGVDSAGNPAPTKVNDSTVVDSLFTQPYYAMLPLKQVTVPAGSSWNGMAPSVSGGVCDKTDPRNWGEPYRSGGYVLECIGYFPVVYAAGDFRVQNGRGQGVLLVAGDLAIAGNFEYDGIIIVLGAVTTTGTGNKITGALLSNNAVIGDDDVFAGNPTVQYSQCAVTTALKAAAGGMALVERSWAQINPR